MTDLPAYVRHVSLNDMRNYREVSVALEPGVNVLVGANGQGKTNLVEAIVYVSTLGSHRVATDAPLIRRGAERAVLRADVVRADRSMVIEIEINPGRANRARINKAPVPKTRDVLGIVRTVVFAPEDLALVKGDPSDRRRFLDDLLIQRQSSMAGVKADFERVLKQRNALLKSAGAARRAHAADVDATLSVWDEQLATYGAQITQARKDLLSALLPFAVSSYAELVPHGEPLHLAYRSSVGDVTGQDTEQTREAMLQLLTARRREELDRGITLVGPHRDEVEVTLGDLPVKGYASHGESWSAALALRLASYDLLTAEVSAPVLILDDVFAELDTSRREHLAQRVKHAPQVVVTAAVPSDVPEELSGTWFDVVAGTVSRRG